MAGVLFLAVTLLCARSAPLLLASFAAHEAGHVLCALLCGCGLPSFSLKPGGFVLRYPGVSRLWQRLTVCLAGPAVSLALAVFLPQGSLVGLYSLGLCTINLLPARGLDGGEVLEAVCLTVFSPAASDRVCRTLSHISVLLLFALNCSVQLQAGVNLSLLFVTLYLTVSILGQNA